MHRESPGTDIKPGTHASVLVMVKWSAGPGQGCEVSKEQGGTGARCPGCPSLHGTLTSLTAGAGKSKTWPNEIWRSHLLPAMSLLCPLLASCSPCSSVKEMLKRPIHYHRVDTGAKKEYIGN